MYNSVTASSSSTKHLDHDVFVPLQTGNNKQQKGNDSLLRPHIIPIPGTGMGWTVRKTISSGTVFADIRQAKSAASAQSCIVDVAYQQD
jgi:hypothetical protein